MDRDDLRECQEAVDILARHGAWPDWTGDRYVVGLWWRRFVTVAPMHLWRLGRVDRYTGRGGPALAVQVLADLGYATVSTWFMAEAQADPRVQQWLEDQGIKWEKAGAAATAPADD